MEYASRWMKRQQFGKLTSLSLQGYSRGMLDSADSLPRIVECSHPSGACATSQISTLLTTRSEVRLSGKRSTLRYNPLPQT